MARAKQRVPSAFIALFMIALFSLVSLQNYGHLMNQVNDQFIPELDVTAPIPTSGSTRKINSDSEETYGDGERKTFDSVNSSPTQSDGMSFDKVGNSNVDLDEPEEDATNSEVAANLEGKENIRADDASDDEAEGIESKKVNGEEMYLDEGGDVDSSGENGQNEKIDPDEGNNVHNTTENEGIDYLDEGDNANESCPSGFVKLDDSILPESITHSNTDIPRVIHFVVRSRCAPSDIYDNVVEWKKVAGYSIVFHDQKDVDELLSKDRDDFPYVPNAAKCALEPIVKDDLVKFLILWEFGGLVGKIDTKPGPIFMNETGQIVEANDECILDFSPYAEDPSPPQFLGCMPKHFLMFSLIQMNIGIHFIQFTEGNFGGRTYTNQRGLIYDEILTTQFSIRLKRNMERTKWMHSTRTSEEVVPKQTVTIINRNASLYPLFVETPMSNSTKEVMEIIGSPVEGCVNFDSVISEPDTDSLLELVGDDNNVETCGSNLTYVQDSYNPDSLISTGGRKIPKVVHMTSKSRCQTDAFAKNIDLWRFEDHSFFLHDDAAVDRLFAEVFTEFPLLQDARHCIHSGAGIADLWRYVLLWKYGGVYTDTDNAPGLYFANGTLINDSTDFLVEQERERFPSQYFIVASPRHPAIYFMVQQAIYRLLRVGNVERQKTAVVTGPGATKVGVMSFMGNGYPTSGNYTGTNNRNMTVVGSTYHARKGLFVVRNAIPMTTKFKEYEQMNMTHFTMAIHSIKGIRHSCLAETYRRRHSDNV